jgi:cellulose synthase/poly-beta-1,6-N-acetylglucosamine synthase-like glycosyltransferase
MNSKRRVAIAVPARDEADAIGACVNRLRGLDRDRRHEPPIIVVAANNCHDQTASIAAAHGAIALSVTLPPERAHAGWARRVALEAAASLLEAPGDLLLCTDADTLVATDWLARTIDHIDAGWDAVAGLARLDPRELRRLTKPHRRRLAMITRYAKALDYLKARQDGSEPWPRHFYEGGASMAVTLRAFRGIGAPPTPRVGEDKALFEAIRRRGGRVRHPLDVKVITSARLAGRAEGGASDTLALWGRQCEDEPIWGFKTIAATLGFAPGSAGDVTFRTLREETERARALIAIARQGGDFALTG